MCAGRRAVRSGPVRLGRQPRDPHHERRPQRRNPRRAVELGARLLTRTPRGVALHNSPADAHIVPRLPDFLRRYPERRLDVSIVAGAMSLEARDFDVAVFLDDPPDSRLVAHRIAERCFRTVATRGYLERHGTPQTPEDLSQHNCLVHVLPTGRAQDVWRYEKGGRQCEIAVRGNLAIDDGAQMRRMALAGLRIGRLPSNNVDALLHDGDDLVRLLADWSSEAPPVHLMHARGQVASPKVRAFAAFVRELFEDSRGDPRPAGTTGPRAQWPMWRA